MNFDNSKNVTINIKPDGSTVIEANGFAGVGCKDATKQLEMVLAGSPSNTDTKPKPDYYATTSTGNMNYR